MKIKSIKLGNYDLDYDGLRHYLIVKSYLGWVITAALRKKYNIKCGYSSSERLKQLIKDHPDIFVRIYEKAYPDIKPIGIDYGLCWLVHDEVEDELFPKILVVARALRLREKLFKIFVLYNNIPFKINGPGLVTHASSLTPIKKGIYIKVDKATKKEDVLYAFSYIKQLYGFSTAQKVTEELVTVRRKQIEPNDAELVNIFLKIEHEMIKVAEKRHSESDDDDDKTIYKRALLQLAGESLDDYEDISDSEFEQRQEIEVERLERIYRVVVRRFSLPTSNDKRDFLKLIGP